VTFEAGCQISFFGEFAFERCSSLKSICIPASVEICPKSCFRKCGKLTGIVFESGSKVSTDQTLDS
jgi:hypothetical protein